MTTKHIALLFFLLLLATSTAACLCTPPQTFRDRFKSSLSVVRVRVISVEIPPLPTPPPCNDQLVPLPSAESTTLSPRPPRPPCVFPLPFGFTAIYKLRVIRTFRGCAAKSPVFFATSLIGPALCGIRLQQDEQYLLYLGPIITGQNPRRFFRLSSCAQHLLWSAVSKPQRAFLRRRSRLPENRCMM